MKSARIPHLTAVAAAALLAGAPAMAQGRMGAPAAGAPTTPAQMTPDQQQPSNPSTAVQSGDPSTGASTGTSANTSATTSSSTQLTTGLTVKDRNGAAIGQIADISTDAKTGQQLATIQMGSEAFRLPVDKLGVFGGAANVNLTQADIEAQLHPGKTSR
jgi:hypothetical protein